MFDNLNLNSDQLNLIAVYKFGYWNSRRTFNSLYNKVKYIFNHSNFRPIFGFSQVKSGSFLPK